MSEARLMLTCGLPGAGKTTLARRLAVERGAVRLTKDDWQWALGSSPWDRDRSLGVGVELHYIDVPIDELWRRIEARNAAPPWVDEPIQRAHLDEWATWFEAPDADELALYDPAGRGGRGKNPDVRAT